MLMFKAKKVAALVLVMLFALTGNVMGAFAEQVVSGEPEVAVDVLAVEDSAASSEELNVAAEAPVAEMPSAPEVTAGPQHFDPLPVIYSVKFVAPDGSEYFIIEVEEGGRLEEPMFMPAVAGYTFEYWYEVVPVSEGSLEPDTAEARVEFDTPVYRDYVILAKLAEIPAQAEIPAVSGTADEDGEIAQAEEAEKETRKARREERKQTAEIIEMVGVRAAGELLSLDGIEIMIISDTDPILEEEEDEEVEEEIIVDGEEAEATDELEETEAVVIEEEEIIVDGEEAEASDELEETEAVVIEEEEEIIVDGEEAEATDELEETEAVVIEEKEEETSEEVIEEEAVVQEEVTVEEEVVVEEDTEAAGGELDMADAAVPLAGCAVNVYTNHKPMMVEGETLEVWGELIGFDNVDVKVQWQYSDGGEWQDMPGANDLTYAVSATGETVNYAWRLAVAVIGK